MKLIPVKIINGDFFNAQISRLNTIIAPPKALTVNIASGPAAMGQKASSNPSATEQIVQRQVPLMNATTYQVGSDLGLSLNKNPLQQLQQSVNLLAIVPPMAPVAKSGNPVRPPVTVQSPVPPGIQCFQIPPQAQVRTVPASDLLAVNKKQTFTPSAKLLCRTSKATSRGLPSKGSEPHFNLVPSVPQRPNSPIKWSVEEEDNSAVPALNQSDSSVSSDILRLLSGRERTAPPRVTVRKPGPAPEPTRPSVASERLRDATERENTGKLCEVIIKSVTGSGQGTSGEKPGNPMFMWNGNQLQQNVRVMALVPLASTPVANSGKSGRPPSDLQVRATSQALPRGLQILPGAQVRKVQASHLPPGIKKQTFPPTVNSLPSSGLPSSGLPSSGLPSSGLPSSGLHSSGLPSSGLLSSGLPSSGLPSSGLPSSGLPSSGLHSSGLHSSGLPSSGLHSSGLPRSGLHSSGLPSSGLPSSGLPSSGLLSSGLHSSGLPSSGLPSSGLPRSVLPSSGLHSSGLPSSGLPSSGLPRSVLPSSGIPSSGLRRSVLPSSGSPSSGLPGLPATPRLTSVKRGVAPLCDSTVDMLKLLHNTSTSYRLPFNGSESHLKLVPNVPQRPDSPIKWSVEDDVATAPSPEAIDTSVSLEILRVACVRENGEKHRDVLRNSASGSSRGKGGQQGEENPSVMWNGKLFVFSKNCSPPDKTGKSDAARKSHEFDQPVAASTPQPLWSVGPRRNRNLGLLDPSRAHKVIDLCGDDDAPDDSSQRADEDTVIFVSYTPPAPEAQDSMPKTRSTHGEEADPAGAASDVPEHESPDETRGAVEGGRLGRDVPVNAVESPTRVNVPEVVTVRDDDDGGDDGRSATNGQQNSSSQQVEGVEVDSSSNGICFGLTERTYIVEVRALASLRDIRTI